MTIETRGQELLTSRNDLKVLTESEIDQIIDSAYQVLETTGCRFEWKPALQALESAGCKVNYDEQMVWFPRDVVKALLRYMPHRIYWQGRTPEYDVYLDSSHLAFEATVGINIIDRKTKKKRPIVLSDLGEWYAFTDQLPNFNTHSPVAGATDAPPCLTGSALIAEQLKYAKKPFTNVGPIGVIQDVDVQAELSEIAGRNSMASVGPISPLTWTDHMCAFLMKWAEKGWPQHLWTGPMPGATAPMPLAGTLVLSLSECFAQCCLAEATNPGAPVMPQYESFMLDMRTGASYIGIEGALTNTAWGQIMHRIGLPMNGWALSNAQTPDWQDGADKAAQFFLETLGGCNEMMCGIMGTVMDTSYAEILRIDALIGLAKRYRRGIEVDEDRLSVDVIDAVGHAPNTYMGQKHTKKYMRTELYTHEILNTTTYDTWVASGGKDTGQRSEELADKIWETLEPDPIDEDLCREIDTTLEKYVKQYS